MRVCAFTGHRNLFGTDFDEQLLKRVVSDLIKNGVTQFLCGMAVGFDLKAAQTVIDLKSKYDVRLVACLPCANQSERFSLKSKQLYGAILARCDEVVVLQEKYTKGCMLARDRYLADNCDVLVCFLRKKTGGTAYTVNYAETAGKKIIYL